MCIVLSLWDLQRYFVLELVEGGLIGISLKSSLFPGQETYDFLTFKENTESVLKRISKDPTGLYSWRGLPGHARCGEG